MPEPRTIICPRCKAELELDGEYYRELQGRSIECPECKTNIPVKAAPAEPAQVKKPLTMRKQSSSGALAGSAKCPHCGSPLEPEAVLCVACGTDLKTGKKLASGIGQDQRTGGRRIARLLVGLLSVAVIAGAGYHMAGQHRQRRAEEQSRQLTGAMVAARNAQNIEAALRRLEEAIEETPLAHNREEALDLRETLRREAIQVPERTRRLRAALDEAAKETDLDKRIALVAPLLETSRGAADLPRAERLVREWRQASRLQSQLAAEIRKAVRAESPAEGIRILQAAIPRFGDAPNLPDAYRLLAELQRQLQAGD